MLLFAVDCLCVSGLILLGARARTGTVSSSEARLHDFLSVYSKHPEFNEPADHLIGLGLQIGVDVVAVGVLVGSAALLSAWGRLREAVVVAGSLSCAVGLTFLLKDTFEPPLGKYELPSGHATRSLLAAGVLVALLWRTRWRLQVAAAGALFVAATGTGLVYADWHLPSDVLGGWALATAVLATAGIALLLTAPCGGSRHGSSRCAPAALESPTDVVGDADTK
jgi:membrane-associated phospholipid phosphatase